MFSIKNQFMILKSNLSDAAQPDWREASPAAITTLTRASAG